MQYQASEHPKDLDSKLLLFQGAVSRFAKRQVAAFICRAGVNYFHLFLKRGFDSYKFEEYLSF